MRCDACGKEIKGRFHKVYLSEINSYVFVCHNCLDVEKVVRYKIKDGITNNIKGCYTPNLKFIQYEDEKDFKNIKEYIYALNERKNYLEQQIKLLTDTDKEVLLFLYQDELKNIKLELKQLQEESDV